MLSGYQKNEILTPTNICASTVYTTNQIRGEIASVAAKDISN
jgi:hypothetical protein